MHLGSTNHVFQGIVHEIYPKFSWSHSKRIQVGSPKIISSHKMEKLLKKGHWGIVDQFDTIQALDGSVS